MKIGILFLLSILTTTKLSPAELTVQAAASLTDANVFLSADEEKLALGETQTVPAGIYAREFLEKLRLWDTIKDEVVPDRQRASSVSRGGIDL